MYGREGTWCCLVVSAMLMCAVQASAHGALAIGGNPNDKSRGFAVGYASNYDTPAEADASAIEYCKSAQNAVPEIRADCKVVVNALHQWIVEAEDPLPGAPGIGWSTNADRATAEREAIEHCQDVSRDDRKLFCVVAVRAYDQYPLSSPDGVSVVDFDLPPVEEFKEGDRWNAYSAAMSAKTGVASSFCYQRKDGIWVFSEFSLDDIMHPNPRTFDDPALSPVILPPHPVEGSFFASRDGILHRFQNGAWVHLGVGSKLRLPNGIIFLLDKRVTPELAARFEATFQSATQQH